MEDSLEDRQSNYQINYKPIMNQIKIKQISLLNFKGIRDLEVKFNDMTIISGKNESGKTTLFDAFTWLLFGKDSSNKSDFNIKTLDANNVAIPQIEHTVSGIFEVNGVTMELRKVYKEKWTKKRQAERAEMTGHTTDYFINEVPMKESEYTERVDGIITEKMFKMLTSPAFFNSMKWQDRRMALTEMVGTISDEEIAGTNMEFVLLLAQLNGKTMDEYAREIAGKKKLLKEELERIPTRIDEVTISMPQTYDYGQLEQEIKARQDKIAQLEERSKSEQETYNSKSGEIKKILDEKLALQQELMKLKNDNRLKAHGRTAVLEAELRQAKEARGSNSDIKEAKTNRYNLAQQTIDRLQKEVDQHREKWIALNEQELVINDAPTHCATCTQPLPADQIEAYKATAEANYNANKLKKLDEIRAQAEQAKREIAQTSETMQTLRDDLQKLEVEIQNNTVTVNGLVEQINQINAEPIQADPNEDILEQRINAITIPEQIQLTDTTREERMALTKEIDGLKQKLTTKEQLERVNKRIEELEKEQQNYAQQLANLEKAEYTMEQFNRIKMDQLETKLNNRFKIVKWRLFQAQINGAMEECCDCLVNGVPISDVNTAGKINAGIDIVNALIDHYHTSAPIWIDNCESVNEVISSRAQMILLYVSTSDLIIL